MEGRGCKHEEKRKPYSYFKRDQEKDLSTISNQWGVSEMPVPEIFELKDGD